MSFTSEGDEYIINEFNKRSIRPYFRLVSITDRGWLGDVSHNPGKNAYIRILCDSPFLAVSRTASWELNELLYDGKSFYIHNPYFEPYATRIKMITRVKRFIIKKINKWKERQSI